MTLFLKHDKSAVASEAIIVKAIKESNKNAEYKFRFQDRTLSSGDSILPRLLERDNGIGTTPDMLKAAKALEIMLLLLNHKSICHLTTDILESVVYGAECFQLTKLLLEHDPTVHIADTTILAALGRSKSVDLGTRSVRTESDGSAVKLPLDRKPALEISDEMLKAVKKADEMRLLLGRRSRKQKLNSAILKSAAEQVDAQAMLTMLLNYDKSAKITAPVVAAGFWFSGTETASLLKIC